MFCACVDACMCNCTPYIEKPVIDIDWYLTIDDQLVVPKICPFAN